MVYKMDESPTLIDPAEIGKGTMTSSSKNCTEVPVPIEEKQDEEEKPSVGFDKIHVREYARCLGNNPAVTHGPPLSIDWGYVEVGSFDLDEYEESRPPRRLSHEMVVPSILREEILLSQTNTTRSQIKRVLIDIKNARHQRQACVAMQEFEEMNLLLETLRRRFRRLKTGISKKREEELMYENARKYAAERAG